MKPPFFGTKVVSDINVHDVADVINREILFASRWQFRKEQSPDEWEEFKRNKILPIYERLIAGSTGIFEPKIVYGYFECKKQETALLVSSPAPDGRVFRFEFPRQRQSPNLCVSDFFGDGFITMQIATIGDKVIDRGARLFNEKKYTDAFYLKGFAAELAEATAEYGHRLIAKELGVPQGRGARFSFGYPAAPNLSSQEKLYTLLNGGRIGVKITETYHLVPEYSTSAIISFSENARQFRP